MDVMSQLTDIEDLKTRTELAHALRSALHHNIVADNTEVLKFDKPEQTASQVQAVAFHRETAATITNLVNRVISLSPPPKAAEPKLPRNKKS